MKHFLFFILFLPLYNTITAQKSTISTRDIRINGLGFYSTKQNIIDVFGKPAKEYQPNYECGFLSDDEQNVTYFTLEYADVKFTGNEKAKYVLDKIKFNDITNLTFIYKGKTFSRQTSVEDFCHFMGVENSKTSFLFFVEDVDNALLFRFTNGFLSSIQYWSPC